MKITILGTGGSLGVPELLCDCSVCLSENPKNKRTRVSLLVETESSSVLIDASPDFRHQALVNSIKKIDAVIVTHAHMDHVSGLDDLKPFARQRDSLLKVYMTEETRKSVEESYSYLFVQKPESIYRPTLEAVTIDEFSELQIGDIKIQTFPQNHGNVTSLGIRIGDFAYSTDFKKIEPRSLAMLNGIKIWVVDCLRYHYAPTHMDYESALDYIAKVKPDMAYLTHMAHEIDYDEISKMLPSNIRPAYDGLVIGL